MIYFLIIYSLLFILLTAKRPKIALFLISALLPTYQIRFKIFGLPTTFLEIMILILFFLWLIQKIKIGNCPSVLNSGSKEKLKIGDWGFLIFIWLIVGFIAIFFSPDKWKAIGHWRAYFLEPILLLVVFLDLAKNDSKLINLIVYGLTLSAFYISFWAIFQKIFGGGMLSLETWQYPLKPIWRATGPFPQANFLGLFLGPIVILAVGKLIESIRSKKLLIISYWLLVIIASIIAIIFAKSEGAILGIFASLIFFLFLVFSSKQRLIFFIFLFVIGCWLLIASPWRNYLWEKITLSDLSGQLRLNIWQATFQLLKDRPIFGVGLRGYQKLIPQYQKPFSLPTGEIISEETHPYPHNLFLAIWTELGLLGLFVFLIIIFHFFRSGFQKLFRNLKLEIRNSELVKSEKISIVAILSAMGVILIHGLVDTPYFKNDLSILFWLIIGLMINKKMV